MSRKPAKAPLLAPTAATPDDPFSLLEQFHGDTAKPPAGKVATAKCLPAKQAPASPPPALYSHTAMVDLMVSQPNYSHEQLCNHFGRPASWLCSVLASEAFQLALDTRRHEVLDPSLTATMQERFKALAIRTSNVMMTKMDGKEVTDFLVLKAGEVAIKALGMGQKGVEQAALPAPIAASTDTLAERLLAMMDRNSKQQIVDIETIEIKPDV